MNATIQARIEQSIRQNEIVKITGLKVDTQEWVDVVNELAVESEDWAETSEDGTIVRKYWGKDEDGDDWRVHVIYEAESNPRDVAERVAAVVGDDGTGDIGVIVRQALKDDPETTDESIIAIVREAREEARLNR